MNSIWGITPETSQISEVESDNFYVYPNPVISGNSVHIKNLRSEGQKTMVNIFDLNGRIVFQKHLSGINGLTLDIDCGKLNKGQYLMQIKTPDNSKYQKLIVV